MAKVSVLKILVTSAKYSFIRVCALLLMTVPGDTLSAPVMSGKVVDYTNTGIPGVMVKFATRSDTAITNSEGVYSFTSLSANLIRFNPAPSPFMGSLQILTDGKMRISAELFNLRGVLVATLNDKIPPPGIFSLFSLVSNLEPGIFLLRLKMDDEIRAYRIAYTGNNVGRSGFPSSYAPARDTFKNTPLAKSNLALADTLLFSKPGFYPQREYVRHFPDTINSLLHKVKNKANNLRITSSVPPSLANVYSACNHAGTQVSLTKIGLYSTDTLKDLGLPKFSIASVKVAPGYRVRFTLANGDFMIKPEDDDCFSDDRGLDGRIVSVTVEKIPDDILGRPRVFMALHGASPLADAVNENKWTYVREHLDGIWYNSAYVSREIAAEIFRKVKTRVVIVPIEGSVRDKEYNPGSSQPNNNLRKTYPDIRIYNEAAAIYKGPLENWRVNEMELGRAQFQDLPVTPDQSWMLFNRVYSGWQPLPFTMDNSTGAYPLQGTEAEIPFNEGDGMFMESPFTHGSNGVSYEAFKNGILLNSKNRKKPFIWFMSHSTNVQENDLNDEFFQVLKNRYFKYEAERLLGPDDVIMIINYDKGDPALGMATVPEIDPATGKPATTLTGMLYWLLHQ